MNQVKRNGAPGLRCWGERRLLLAGGGVGVGGGGGWAVASSGT